MASIQNLASGILESNITDSATSITVYVGSGNDEQVDAVFPTAPFYITVMPNVPAIGVSNSMDSEIMLVTAVGSSSSGNIPLTVTRAQKGTTSRAFNSGAIVTNGIYTDDILDVYSTEEKATNKRWVDNKIIYKRTFVDTFTTPAVGTRLTVDLIASGVDNVIKAEGYYSPNNSSTTSGEHYVFGGAALGSSEDAEASVRVNNSNKVQFLLCNYATSYVELTGSYAITVYYTKTS